MKQCVCLLLWLGLIAPVGAAQPGSTVVRGADGASQHADHGAHGEQNPKRPVGGGMAPGAHDPASMGAAPATPDGHSADVGSHTNPVDRGAGATPGHDHEALQGSGMQHRGHEAHGNQHASDDVAAGAPADDSAPMRGMGTQRGGHEAHGDERGSDHGSTSAPTQDAVAPRGSGMDRRGHEAHGDAQASDDGSAEAPAHDRAAMTAAKKSAAGDHSAHRGHPGMGQSEGPPANARDPHAWSAGYTLDSGAHVIEGPRLRLADQMRFGAVAFDRLERDRYGSRTFDLQAWYGTTWRRLILQAEGESDGSGGVESSTEVLFSRAVSPFWNAGAGIRVDSGDDARRRWLVLALQGLAPWWVEVDASIDFADDGMSALGVEVEYDSRLTQRLILQPRAEVTLYGQDDAEHGIGSGLADAVFGLRLRYEIRREFAPYIGVETRSLFGATRRQARARGAGARETVWLAGLRAWF